MRIFFCVVVVSNEIIKDNIAQSQSSPNICDGDVFDDVSMCDGVFFWICRLECVSLSHKFLFILLYVWNTVSIYSTAAYLRVQVTSLTVMVATNSFSVNSRMMVDGGSPPTSWINLFPSSLITLFTLRPSIVSSSNSSPNLNVMVDVLNVDDVTKEYWSPSFFNSTVGLTELPILRRTKPTPLQLQRS